jgi:hypothetical protein
MMTGHSSHGGRLIPGLFQTFQGWYLGLTRINTGHSRHSRVSSIDLDTLEKKKNTGIYFLLVRKVNSANPGMSGMPWYQWLKRSLNPGITLE